MVHSPFHNFLQSPSVHMRKIKAVGKYEMASLQILICSCYLFLLLYFGL